MILNIDNQNKLSEDDKKAFFEKAYYLSPLIEKIEFNRNLIRTNGKFLGIFPGNFPEFPPLSSQTVFSDVKRQNPLIPPPCVFRFKMGSFCLKLAVARKTKENL